MTPQRIEPDQYAPHLPNASHHHPIDKIHAGIHYHWRSEAVTCHAAIFPYALHPVFILHRTIKSS